MHNANSMLDFNAFTSASGLLDARYRGSNFTWSNKRVGGASIKARLDRILLSIMCQVSSRD